MKNRRYKTKINRDLHVNFHHYLSPNVGMEAIMITRTWHGIVPIEKKSDFSEYLNETGVKESLAINGNLAAYVHIVEQNEYAHFFLCTIWSCWKDILLFAGNEPNIAVTYPEDSAYGLISDPIVIHQEVTTNQNPFIKALQV